jgi:hypothetical protein
MEQSAAFRFRVIRVFRGLKDLCLLRFFQQPFAFAIQLPPLARGQTSNPKLGNFIENRVD